MRAVIQRVECAGVKINQKEVSSIKSGILVFLGIEKEDTQADADYILDKSINLRIFEDKQGKMNHSLLDTQGEMLVVSQFTLLADCRKGRRPSFVSAEEPQKAQQLYDYFLNKAGKQVNTCCGKFQEMMKISLVNSGPVTVLLDSRKKL